MAAQVDATASVHVLIIPYPAQGHAPQILDLAHRLALAGISITILTTPKNLPSLSPLLRSHPTSLLRPLLFPFPHHPSLPPGVENVRQLGNRGNLPIISALSSLRLPVLDWFRSHPDPPVAIISDFFQGWTWDVAREIGIPRIAFFSVGALLASVLDFCWENLEAVKASDVVELTDLPNKPVFREEQLPSIFRLFRKDDPDWEIVRDGSRKNMLSWGCIFNSFVALDGVYLNHIESRVGRGRVYAVGPLSLLGIDDASVRGNPNEGSADDLLGWLDGCDDGSVLYVCFGSQKTLLVEQIEALAGGLERSGIRFVWVVKIGPGLEEVVGQMLDSFVARVGDRGRVVSGWVPQALVLNHRAVGGFLSHCGWNSMMEAVVAGKMILGWPMEADQYVNARFLVDDLGVASRVFEGADAVPDPDELCRSIVGSMMDGGPEKARAKDLQKMSMAAVEPESGSSSKDLARLIEDLRLLSKRY